MSGLMLQERGVDPVAYPDICPNCGFDLVSVLARQVGKLFVDKSAISIAWNGKPVPLTCGQRLMTSALARANGHIVSYDALANVEGYGGFRPEPVVRVHLCHIRKAFREMDPDFDQIETDRGRGVRWRV